eukprot:c24191_g1_i2 orf=592-741(+)
MRAHLHHTMMPCPRQPQYSSYNPSKLFNTRTEIAVHTHPDDAFLSRHGI